MPTTRVHLGLKLSLEIRLDIGQEMSGINRKNNVIGT